MTFRLTGPLPHGTTVIQASAGTGKTYAIVGLATRFIAEGAADIADLMMVTFGRAATQELRDRARERLVECAHALDDAVAARASKDGLIRHLATADDDEIGERRRRLLRAVSDFDGATIVTTHAFCQRMLDGIGLAGDYDPAAVFRDNVDDMLSEVIEDRYVADYSAEPTPALTLADASTVARAAAKDPRAALVPTDATPGSEAARRMEFAAAARAELIRRKRTYGIRDFDDLQQLLCDALADPAFGPVACSRIRARYRFVLVDEFQDTDPTQWDILRRAFHGAVTMVLVGDPKQAIYAFRGGDVMTYLAALDVAGMPEELTVNFRTDDDLMRALDNVYGGAALGPDQITVYPVTADRQGSRLPSAAALRLRYLDNTGSGPPTKKTGYPPIPRVRQRVADDVARDIVQTLDAGLQFDDGDGSRPLEPSDIAVLVRKRDQASMIQDALTRANVPSVLTGSSSVFTTPAATAWARLLAALEQPNRPGRLRLAALSPLIGHDAADLASGGDDLLAMLSTELRSWATTFTDFGVAAGFEVVASARNLDVRMLRIEGGERLLTDLRHLSQLLNRAADAERLGLTSLNRWLAHRIDDAKLVTEADRGRLLDRDSAAVRVVTIHSSKGLEFPVVYLPYPWDAVKPNTSDALLMHEDGRRVRDVGGDTGPGHDDREVQAAIEDAGEELRLFYVAATRARSRVVAWWAPSVNTSESPLHRLVFGRPDGQAQPEPAPDIPPDRELATAFAAWASPQADVITVEAVPANEPAPMWTPQPHAPVPLGVASFDRTLNWLWRRNSFTRLTEDSHQRNVGSLSEADESSTIDEPAVTETVVGAAAAEARTPSLMNDLPAGAPFGTLVHSVLESVDTSAADLAVEVHTRTADVARRGFTAVDVNVLASALTAVLTTPTPHGRLADVAPANRLAEVEFELPLAGGEDTTGTAGTLIAMADLMAGLLPPDDPLIEYPDTLRTLPDVTLRGYLTGSLDAVLRVDGPKFLVVDYKTNKLFAGRVDAEQFDEAAMAAEMMRKHYPLQALLYSVALHRYLLWRQADYDPDCHLGGVMYLFVRAMVGVPTPPGCGVFSWRPPTELVVGLSEVLAGRPTR